jgi:SHS2 domain-containing protein
MGRWVEIEHTADLALHVWGQDLVDLFTTAARGMFALVALPTDETVLAVRRVELRAPDVETLLVDWLNELLYLHEVEDIVVVESAFERLTRSRLEAEVRGAAVGERRAHIKAVTFHNLAVTSGPEGYEAELVFDV